jgi:hypothetical protein
LDIVEEKNPDTNLLDVIRTAYERDSFLKKILEKPKDFRNFIVEDRLIYLKESEQKLLCIPEKVIVNGHTLREIIISEVHSLLAHLGSTKTSTYLRDHVWWKALGSDVQKFCESCMTCKRSKPSNQKPYGLLNPLDVPSYPWESIGIDFLGPLPESSDRDSTYNSITVVIDLLTAMVHLIPSRTNYTAPQLAELIFAEVYKHHGLPRNIISDRDVLFTSNFWQALHKLLNVNLKMSSAYHPETDGATERANRTITQMIRQCINADQKDWVQKLPAVQMAINLARSDTTGYSPFFLNTGRIPRNVVWNSPSDAQFPGVAKFAQRVKLALMSAHDSIIAARVKQTRDANRHRRKVPFVVDDLIYISTKNLSFKKGLARKLSPKYIGPYRILKDFGNSSFLIDLPPSLKQRGVHPVYHAQYLRIHHPNDDRLFPGRLDSQLGIADQLESEWKVDQIVSHRGSGVRSHFRIKWSAGDKTWLPYENAVKLSAFQDYLDTLGITDIAQLKSGEEELIIEDELGDQASLGFVAMAMKYCFSNNEPSDQKKGGRRNGRSLKTRSLTSHRSFKKHTFLSSIATVSNLCLSNITLSSSTMTSSLAELTFCYRSKDMKTLFVPPVNDSFKTAFRVSRSQAQEFISYSVELTWKLTEEPPPLGYEEFREALKREKAFEGRELALRNANGDVEGNGDSILLDELLPPSLTPSASVETFDASPPLSPPPPLPESEPVATRITIPIHTPPYAPSENDESYKPRKRKRVPKHDRGSGSSAAPTQAPSSSSSSIPSSIPGLNSLAEVLSDPTNLLISTKAAFKSLGFAQRREEIFKQQLAQRKAKRLKAAKEYDSPSRFNKPPFSRPSTPHHASTSSATQPLFTPAFESTLTIEPGNIGSGYVGTSREGTGVTSRPPLDSVHGDKPRYFVVRKGTPQVHEDVAMDVEAPTSLQTPIKPTKMSLEDWKKAKVASTEQTDSDQPMLVSTD